MEEEMRFSTHARLRCQEMGVPLDRARRVVKERVLSYRTSRHGNAGEMCMSDDPGIAVVWDPERRTIITVLPRTQEEYRR